MLRRALLVSTALFLLVCGHAQAAEPAAVAAAAEPAEVTALAEPAATASPTPPGIARQLTTECAVAAAAAAVIVTVLPAVAGPVAAAAIGVPQGISVVGAAAYGCGAGAASSLMSTGAILAWDERDTIRQQAETHLAQAWEAGSAAVAGLAGAAQQIAEPVQTAVAGAVQAVAEPVQVAVSGLLDQGMQMVVAATESTLMALWTPATPRHSSDIDVAVLSPTAQGYTAEGYGTKLY